MSIDKNIYSNGIKGLLSYWEIDSLPKDYEIFKGMFKEATDTKQGKKTCFSQDKFSTYEPACHKPMSEFRKELRAMQVISRATYGMQNTRFIEKTNMYGEKRDVAYVNNSFMAKVKFWCNPVRLWRIFLLYWNLRKKWHEDEKAYREAKKRYKKVLKEYKKKYNTDNIQYDMDNHEWRPCGRC